MDLSHLRGPAATASAVLLALAVWTGVTAAGLVDATTLPSPASAIGRVVDMAFTPFAGETLGGHLAASVGRWLVGVLAGCAVGVPLGVLVSWSPRARAAISPLLEVVRFIPPFAWIPLAILWFGISLQAQALVVAVAAFPPALLNTSRGLTSVDTTLVNASRSLGATTRQTLRLVAFPTALPSVLTGVRLSFSNGWMALVGAELVGARSGLGYVIARAQSNLTTELVVGGMVVIAIAGVVADLALRAVTRSLLTWTEHS